MRHMLITVPVAILLSLVACGDNGQEPSSGMGNETEQGVTGNRQQGEIQLGENLDQALEQDSPNTFVREANAALDKAESHLRTLGTQTEQGAQDDRQEIQQDITEARQDLQQLSAQTAGDWKQSGREVEQKIEDIERGLNDLAG